MSIDARAVPPPRSRGDLRDPHADAATTGLQQRLATADAAAELAGLAADARDMVDADGVWLSLDDRHVDVVAGSVPLSRPQLDDLVGAPGGPVEVETEVAGTAWSVLAVPLLGMARVVGRLVAFRRSAAGFGPSERIALRVAAELAAAVHAAVPRRPVESRSVHADTDIDVLTGLPGRAAVHRWLAAALERSSGAPVGALFCDVDAFGDVNAEFGQAAGDDVLAEVAVRVRDAVRPTDLVGRIGGDDFMVLVEHLAHEATLEVMAERIRAAVAQPVALPGGGTVEVGISIGAIAAEPGRISAAALLDRADAAMYVDKARRRQLGAS